MKSLLMQPKGIWLNLSVLFSKDVVGTGRTMKALLSSIEKYKPNMIKVARWVLCSHHHCFCLSKSAQEGCKHWTLVPKNAVHSKPLTLCPGALGFDHTEQTAHLTASLRERKGERTCFAVYLSPFQMPLLAVSRSSWPSPSAHAPLPPFYPESHW